MPAWCERRVLVIGHGAMVCMCEAGDWGSGVKSSAHGCMGALKGGCSCECVWVCRVVPWCVWS